MRQDKFSSTTTHPSMSISSIQTKVNKVSIKLNNDENGTLNSKKLEILTNFKSTPTIISRDLKIQGEVFSSGIIEILGQIDGSIKGNSIILREEGFIKGIVLAENFSIRGRFDGKIKAKNINIASKAEVTGEIEYESLSVEDGASIDGHFKKTKL